MPNRQRVNSPHGCIGMSDDHPKLCAMVFAVMRGGSQTCSTIERLGQGNLLFILYKLYSQFLTYLLCVEVRILGPFSKEGAKRKILLSAGWSDH